MVFCVGIQREAKAKSSNGVTLFGNVSFFLLFLIIDQTV